MTALADLTLPLAQSTTLHALYTRYLRRQSKLMQKLPWGKLLTTQSEVCETLLCLVDTTQTEEPGLYFSILRQPSVGGALRSIENALRDGNLEQASDWAAGLFCQLAVELWQAGKIREPLRVLVGRPVLLCESDDWFATVPDGFDCIDVTTEGLFFCNTGSKVREPVDSNRPCGLEIRDGISLCLGDVNPLALNEAHPDQEGNRLNLGEASTEQWVSSLSDALELIDMVLPELYAEMKMVLRWVVPVGVDSRQHVSASYQEVVGTIYLSLHPNVITMAEALIHEFSHTKLNILGTFDAMFANAFSPHFPSPYRPDARPLHGILLGVHAFLPIERFLERLAAKGHPQSLDPGFQRRRLELRGKNRVACETLVLHGEASEVGQGLLDEIVRLNGELGESLR